MKKLMIAMAVALLGFASHAAIANWVIKSDWVSSDGENPLEVAVYAFDALANPLAVVTAALESGDMSVLGNAVSSGVVNDEGSFQFSGNGGITDNGDTPPVVSVYTIFLDTDSASTATGYFASDVRSAELTDAVMADKASFAWDEINVTSFTPMSDVPEPTSGLLLLLGVAGLALRRKQA